MLLLTNFASLGGRLTRLALKIGTNKVARKRGVISDSAYPAAGDILLYEARGSGIRNFIENTIQKTPKPCILIAHSLGGIACVDLLAQKKIDGVSLLITAGSQAPLLYELNALVSLPHGTSLPEGFPPWLNLYDKHDFLSYIGAGVFPKRVTDVLVNNGQPFPQAHSAYWKNPEVWNAIVERLL
jgi:pimeloyl-ACP methyl ester carboxylesterase